MTRHPVSMKGLRWRGGPFVGTGRRGGICWKGRSPIKRSYFYGTEEVQSFRLVPIPYRHQHLCQIWKEWIVSRPVPYRIIISPTQVINSSTLGGCLKCWQMAVLGWVRMGGRIYARIGILLENEANYGWCPPNMEKILDKPECQLNSHYGMCWLLFLKLSH